MRDEYIAIKAELIAIFRRVDDLADKFQLTPVRVTNEYGSRHSGRV